MNLRRVIHNVRRWVYGAAATAVLLGALLPGTTPAHASSGLPSAVFDPSSTGRYSCRNVPEATSDAQFDEKAAAGLATIVSTAT